MSDGGAPARDLGDDRIITEAAHVAASPEFARAPVMRRLLDFLVAETLAGRADQLKAYGVAVDGLGRSPDFDAQGDSYPRVQVGRLRKMLDAFYARNASAAGVRLSIPQGRYRVTFDEEGSAETGGGGASHIRALPWAAIAILSLLLLIVMLLAFRPRPEAGSQPVSAPMLELMPLTVKGADPAVAEAVRATLLDSMRRTWLIRVSAARRNGPPDPDPIPPRYRLSGDLTGGARPTLFLRLWRMSPDRLIWSDRVALPADPADQPDALSPAVAALIQPYGVIASNERAERGEDASPDYPCLLRFDHYRRARGAALHAEVSRCLDRTLALDPENATALAASSAMVIDARLLGYPGGGTGATIRATRLATQAVAADPFSGFAHYALARAALHGGACPSAVRSGMRAIELNPNDPTLYAAVGLFLVDCGDPRAESLVRRAILLDPSAPGPFYAPLVYLAVDRGDGAAARDAALHMLPVSADASATFTHLTLAVGLAAAGDEAGARAAWAALSHIAPEVARDPQAYFVHVQLAPRLRAKSIAHLARIGLVAQR